LRGRRGSGSAYDKRREFIIVGGKNQQAELTH
jgi:hypothetical protein